MKYDFLVKEAFKAMENAYAPYSNFHVGACVLCKDGTMFKGANIENASFGATSCAERNAIFAAYSNGYRKSDIEAVSIVCSGHDFAAPCGICRQVLNELMDVDAPVILGYEDKVMETSIRELLPMRFTEDDLK